MLRLAAFVGFVLFSLTSSGSGLCQGIPGGYPVSRPVGNRCDTRPAVEPITRTVQVDVPVPCPPPTRCVPVGACSPYPCCPSPCPPPCPTRPVQVRIDVRVRPEPCCGLQAEPKAHPDPLQPVLGLVAATMAVPIRVLETLFPPPVRCNPPRPECGPLPYATHLGYPPPATPPFAPGLSMPSAYPASSCPPAESLPPPPPARGSCMQPAQCGRDQAAPYPERASHGPINRPFPYSNGERFRGYDGPQPSSTGEGAR